MVMRGLLVGLFQVGLFQVGWIKVVDCTCVVGKYYGCNDMEMFQQCDKAQQTIIRICDMVIGINNTYELVSEIPDLECDRYIYCYTSLRRCQNIDSLGQCKKARVELENFITLAQDFVEVPSRLLEMSRKLEFRCEKDNSDSVDDYSSGHRLGVLRKALFVGILFVLVL